MRRYIVFALVSMSSLIASISNTSITVAFKDIISSFNASVVEAGWVLTISQLTFAVTMPLAGKACDIIGKKLTFVICMASFSLGSIVGLIAPNLPVLVFARFIQSIGVGGALPVVTAIVADEFPEERARYIGFLTSIFPIGQLIGPNLGGWLTMEHGWRANFLFFIPPGLIATLLASLFLRSGKIQRKAKLDILGVGYLTGAMSFLMVGISLMGTTESGIPWTPVGLCFAAGILFTFLFLRHQNHTPDPFIDLAILKKRPFMATNVFNLLWGCGVMGFLNFVPYYAVTVYGMSILESGFILTPRAVVVMITALVTSILLRRLGYRKPMAGGMLLFVLSMLLLAFEFKNVTVLGWEVNSVVLVSGILIFAGLGQGMANPAANNACIELMPDRVAMITGIRGLFRQIGGTVSIGIFALILNGSADPSAGFRIILISTAALSLLSLPFIMMVPDRTEIIKAPMPDQDINRL